MKVLVVILIKDNRLGFSKIDRDLQIDLRVGHATAHAKLPIFVIFKQNWEIVLQVYTIYNAETPLVLLKSRATILGLQC